MRFLATKNGYGHVQPGNLYRPNLLGGSVEWDIDLSNVGCGCNAAIYMVLMPGKNTNGVPNPGEWGNYYCDANDVGGQWCPEMDMMEANNLAWHTTPHRCD